MTEATRRVVDLDKLKIPFAIDIFGAWVKAPDVDLAAPPINPKCPGCGEPVTFRRGSVGRIPHFAHRPNSSCSNEGYEGLSHQKLKEAVAVLIEDLGADALIHAAPPEAKGRHEAILEETYPGSDGLRSDVGVTLADGKLLGFEIIVANKLELWKINRVTDAGNLICAMNGFGFTEHIMQNGGNEAFDLDADARAFVLQWRFTMKRGVAPGTKKAAPAGVEFIGGTAINCDAVPGVGLSAVSGSAPLRADAGWYTADSGEKPAASFDDIARQHALRKWHTNPLTYPMSFQDHLERGDFHDVLGSERVNNE
jgi:hypothetical protein